MEQHFQPAPSNFNCTLNNLLEFSKQYKYAALYHSNSQATIQPNCIANAFEVLFAVSNTLSISTDNFQEFQQFAHAKWLFGKMNYNAGFEHFKHNFPPKQQTIQSAQYEFFEPELMLLQKNKKWYYFFSVGPKLSANTLLQEIQDAQLPAPIQHPINFTATQTKEFYLNNIQQVLQHIQQGNVYELNYCQEFIAKQQQIQPEATFLKLLEVSPTPFSAFLKINQQYALSASPERYLKKEGTTICSQPIKGTAKRGATPQLDAQQIEHLQTNPKELAENVMIVDLVRNDLSHFAQKNSVQVNELFKIYTFPQVHQMISTISCELKENTPYLNTLKYSFPMGSMTGAPKLSAMQIIHQLEPTERGLYSGSIGYITPNHNFDFNVVIRTLLFDAQTQTLSFHVGGAITADSQPESEYQETLLKALAILNTLEAQIN